MKTIIFEEIDGYQIIKGFGKLAIDPVETKKAAKAHIERLPETQAFRNHLEATKKARLQLRELRAKKEIVYRTRRVFTEKLQKDLDLSAENYEEKRKKSKDTYQNFEDAVKNYIKSNPVYFQPGKNQKAIEDVDFVRLSAMYASRGGKLCSIDGELLDDHRGKRYFDASLREIIVKNRIGPVKLPKSAREFSELTDSERETVRIQGLSDEEKVIEKNARIDQLAEQAALMRTKLEITGDADALRKAQAYYSAELQKIEVLYG